MLQGVVNQIRKQKCCFFLQNHIAIHNMLKNSTLQTLFQVLKSWRFLRYLTCWVFVGINNGDWFDLCFFEV